MLVKRRVDEELERRKDEIEAEVTRRVEAAKQQMEQEMMTELERRREKAREDERKREVGFALGRAGYYYTLNTLLTSDFRQRTLVSSNIRTLSFKFRTSTKHFPPPDRHLPISNWHHQRILVNAFCSLHIMFPFPTTNTLFKISLGLLS